MDVELNVGRPTAAKTRAGRKWVPMQLRSHLGIYRIGCRAYLIGPRLCFLPLAPAVFAFHFKTSTSVRPSVRLHHHYFHHHHLITIFSSTSTKHHLPRQKGRKTMLPNCGITPHGAEVTVFSGRINMSGCR